MTATKTEQYTRLRLQQKPKSDRIPVEIKQYIDDLLAEDRKMTQDLIELVANLSRTVVALSDRVSYLQTRTNSYGGSTVSASARVYAPPPEVRLRLSEAVSAKYPDFDFGILCTIFANEYRDWPHCNWSTPSTISIEESDTANSDTIRISTTWYNHSGHKIGHMFYIHGTYLEEYSDSVKYLAETYELRIRDALSSPAATNPAVTHEV